MNKALRQTRQYLTDLFKRDTFGIPDKQVKAAINQSLMHYMPFMYVMVAFFFVVYAVLQIFVLREPGASIMILVAFLSAGILLLGLLVLRSDMAPPHLAEWFTAFGAALILGSIVLRAQLTADPKQAANLALFLFAMAILFFSPFWYIVFSFLTVGALVLAFLTFPPSTDWPYFIVVTLAAMATGFVAHIVRVRSYRHTVVLRIVEKKQRQALQRRTTQLHTAVGVGKHVTSILDLDTLLTEIADLVWQKYNVYYVGVFLPDAAGLRLTAVAQAGQEITAETPAFQAGMRGFQGWVMQHGQALRVDNVLQDDRFVPEEATPRTQSELVLPLIMGGDLLGVLDLQSDRSMAFAKAELPAFQLLADQVTIALENARLYDEVKRFNLALEEKVAERTKALQEAYARLERLDKTKTDFITIASHELRTPLTIVNFNSQMFLEDEEIQQNSLYKGWAEGIYRGVTRMEEVVENILDVAKIDSSSLDLFFSPLNIRFLLQQVVSRLERELEGRDLTFTLTKMPDLPEIEADAEAMEKLFQHILMNAVKFTPDGGFVKIDGRLHQEPLNGEGPIEAVEIVVADTGIGIAPEIQDLIFEKFFQTGNVQHHSSGKTSFKGGGSGIGLAIAKGIVEAHNGRIRVESVGYDEVECPGCAVHVVLPVCQIDAAANSELSISESR